MRKNEKTDSVVLRPKVEGFPNWRGIVRQGSPSLTPANSVWNAENVRLRGGVFVSRGGEAKVNSSPLADLTIHGFHDAGDIGAAEAWTEETPTGPLGESPCTEALSERLYIAGGGSTSERARTWAYDGTTLDDIGDGPAGVAGYGHVYNVISGGTCLVHAASPAGVNRNTVELRIQSPNGGTADSWFTFGDVSEFISNMAYLTDDSGSARLVMGVGASAGSGIKPSVRSTTDAAVITTERETDSAPGSGSQCQVLMAKHPVTGKLWVSMYDSPTSTNYGLFERAAGGGSYTRIPIDTAAGQIDSGTYVGIQTMGVFVTSIADDQGVYHVYMFGRSSVGTTLVGVYPEAANPTEVRLGFDSGAASGSKGVHCAADFNGLTYFGYGDDASGAAIASVTWSAGVQGWTTVVFNFTSNFPADSLDSCVCLRAYGSNLYAICEDSGAPNRTYLYKSSGSNVASWSKVGEITDVGGTSFDCQLLSPQYQMVVL